MTEDRDAAPAVRNDQYDASGTASLGRNLRFWLASPFAAPFDPGDAPLALGALLLRAARTDHAGLFADPTTFEAVLALCYDLTAREASEMREACERVAAAAPDCASFAEILQRAVGLSDRERFALSLHQVLMALGPSQDAQREALSQLFLGAHSATDPAPLRAG